MTRTPQCCQLVPVHFHSTEDEENSSLILQTKTVSPMYWHAAAAVAK